MATAMVFQLVPSTDDFAQRLVFSEGHATSLSTATLALALELVGSSVCVLCCLSLELI